MTKLLVVFFAYFSPLFACFLQGQEISWIQDAKIADYHYYIKSNGIVVCGARVPKKEQQEQQEPQVLNPEFLGLSPIPDKTSTPEDTSTENQEQQQG